MLKFATTQEFLAYHSHIQMIWKRESRLMRCCGKLMGGEQGKFMLLYATTIGNKIYMPKTWWDGATEQQRLILLRHEEVHVRQMKKYSVVFFFFLYLFVFFPVGLGYFRAKFEKEAYSETLRARHEYWGENSISSHQCRNWVIQQFTSSTYGWMWPFKKHLNRWYDKQLNNIIE